MTGIAGQRLIRFRIEDYGIIIWMNKIDFLKENKNRLFENYFKRKESWGRILHYHISSQFLLTHG